MVEDGGYYSIKGFEYQLDKSILDIFSTELPTDLIYIEKIQDISSNNFVIQVKYKETQDYAPSKIRKPIIQLINEFQKDDAKTYYLYCHFNNKEEEIEKLNIESLNIILGEAKDCIPEVIKLRFIKSFILSFSKNYQTQFKEVINIISSLDFCHDDEEAIYYYSIITNHIRKKIIGNQDKDLRCFCKKEIIEKIRNSRKVIFDSSYLEYKGKVNYLKKIKSTVEKLKRRQSNYIFMGSVEEDCSMSIGRLIINILDKYYLNAQHDIKPLTFIISDDHIKTVKKDLIINNIMFNDGYENIHFNEEIFFFPHIINKKQINNRPTSSLDKISFKLRLISKSNFDQITNIKVTPNITYYFNDRPSDSHIYDYYVIDGLTTSEIMSVII